MMLERRGIVALRMGVNLVYIGALFHHPAVDAVMVRSIKTNLLAYLHRTVCNNVIGGKRFCVCKGFHNVPQI